MTSSCRAVTVRERFFPAQQKEYPQMTQMGADEDGVDRPTNPL